jgi:hypothetical protein
VVFGVLLLLVVVGFVVLFRSFRRWREPPPTTPEQLQAQMRLYDESHQTDRW